jgi:hypothetical protein
MKDAPSSSETFVLTRATRRNIQEDEFLQFSLYLLHTAWDIRIKNDTSEPNLIIAKKNNKVMSYGGRLHCIPLLSFLLQFLGRRQTLYLCFQSLYSSREIALSKSI